ncbi:107-domain-containing protein [Dichotomocladium elegans]|nr:107-domain-containing protein [Dichotomocladium elegans]
MTRPPKTIQMCGNDLDTSLIEILDSPQEYNSEIAVVRAIHDLVMLRLAQLEEKTAAYSTRHQHQEINFLRRVEYIWNLIDLSLRLGKSRSPIYQNAQLRAYMEKLIKQYDSLSEDELMAEIEEEVRDLARQNGVLSEKESKERNIRTSPANEYEVTCQSIFRSIKSGDINKAITISRAEDKPWKTLLLLQHIEEKKKALEGKHADLLAQQRAALRDLYKRSLYEVEIGKHEAALLGTLCGDLSRILPICSSWYDVIWAYYNSRVQDAIDGEVYGRLQNDDNFWVDANHIKLAKDKTKNITDGLSLSFAMLTLNILRGNIQEGITYCCSQLGEKEHEGLRINEDSWPYPYMLSFLSSLILYSRIYNNLPSTPETDKILALYARMSVKKPNFRPKALALCAAHLTKKMQISVVSDFFAGNYWDSDERELLFDMGMGYGLHMEPIIRRTWEITLRDYYNKESPIHREPRGIRLEDDDVGDVTVEMTCGTRRCFKQFGWLLMDEHVYHDAIKACNELMAHFLKNEQPRIAKAFFDQIPQSVVNMVLIQSSGSSLGFPRDVYEFQKFGSLLGSNMVLKN